MIIWARDRWGWSRNYRDFSIVHWQRSRYWRQGFLSARLWFFKVRSAGVTHIIGIVSWKSSLKECFFP